MAKLPLMILFFAFLSFFVQSRSANCSRSHHEALINLKDGLIDPSNQLSSWLGNTDCCQWRGIECDDITGDIIAVHLHNLSGVISPSLLKIVSLRRLDLSFNLFEETTIPELLGSLKNLEYLNLSKAGFSGLIPQTIGNLSLLEYLDVSCEFSALSIIDFEWVTSLTNLKLLNMNQVDLSLVGPNWSRILAKLGYLTELHMSSCSLTGAFPSFSFVNFTALSILDLSGNTFFSNFPFWLTNVSSLVSVDLNMCSLKGRIPLGLSELPNLRYLNLEGNQELSASSSQLFRGTWKKIEVLKLGGNKIHGKLPNSIGNLSSLSIFELNENLIEGGIPSSIGKLCKLVRFDMSSNNLTGVLPNDLERTENCDSAGPFPSLVYFKLFNNRISGIIPLWLGKVENLVEIDLSYNIFEGTIPASIGLLQNLTDISLGNNFLNGSLPSSLGQLSMLSLLDVSSNRLSEVVSEAHFSKLRNLKLLHMSGNSLVFSVSSGWDPPFRARYLDLGSCQLGPFFPNWIRSQGELMFLDISNASISGSIPLWFWDISANLSLLNVSLNRLEGQLPNHFDISPFADVDFSYNLLEGPLPLPRFEIELLDFSNNRFSGPVPRNFSKSMPNLIYLSLSNNQITGEVPVDIGDIMLLQVIDMSNNNLTGTIPSSIGNLSYLKALDLGNNNFSGNIPPSLGSLNQLQSLHLSDNMIFGEIPFSFRNLSSLVTLDLRQNLLSGEIPLWFGDGFANLEILNLRSNLFSGKILPELSRLSSLQVLDLAENNFSGGIPPSFGDFKAMLQEQKDNKYRFYGFYRGMYYEESLVVNTKGQFQTYTKTLSLVVSIDLSGNKLSGEFPTELTKLLGLVVLNLSMNQITGQIPQRISDLHELASLDLSSNKLNGAIPQSMTSLTFLSYLNLSHNNFFGRIPYTGQMATFTGSCYEGNLGLCGAPLAVKCQTNSPGEPDQVETVEDANGNVFLDKWFCLSVGVGFAVGILVPFFIIAIWKPWNYAYFNLVEKIVAKCFWT